LVKVPALRDHYQHGVDDVQVTQIPEIESVFRESGDRLWWALLAYTGSREIASDASAEAFARALADRDSIRDAAAWIWRVAFRVATSEVRAKPPEELPAQPHYELDERALAVMLALRRLTRRQRAVFVLFYLDDRPAKEIAELLGMAPATVSVHLHRARRRLRSILGDDDG
jgi:RNA polymerase sigma factor (sigma-70 family)